MGNLFSQGPKCISNVNQLHVFLLCNNRITGAHHLIQMSTCLLYYNAVNSVKTKSMLSLKGAIR